MGEIVEKIKKVLDFGTGKYTVGTVLAAIVLFLVCMFVIRLILRIVRKAGEKSKLDNSAIGYVVTVVKAVLYFIVVIIICDVVGIPISSLIAVLSIAGLAISLSVQNLLSNLVSGFVILVTKPFIGGDFVDIAGKSGNIKAVGFVHTTLVTPDNKSIFIPNKEVSEAEIINYTREEKRRVDLVIDASYYDSAENVKRSISQAFGKIDKIISEPAPFIGLKEYGSSAISYDIRVWCRNEDYWDVYYKLNEQIKVQFDSDGITMTYDHINVHMVDDN